MTDDPIRRDREGWDAGVRACISNLEDFIKEWEEEALQHQRDELLLRFIRQRIAHTNVLIWRLRELKYGGLQ